MDSQITDMEWSTNSLNLNCIEILWGILLRRLYKSGLHCDTKEDLEENLFYELDKIQVSYIRTLIKPM